MCREYNLKRWGNTPNYGPSLLLNLCIIVVMQIAWVHKIKARQDYKANWRQQENLEQWIDLDIHLCLFWNEAISNIHDAIKTPLVRWSCHINNYLYGTKASAITGWLPAACGPWSRVHRKHRRDKKYEEKLILFNWRCEWKVVVIVKNAYKSVCTILSNNRLTLLS